MRFCFREADRGILRVVKVAAEVRIALQNCAWDIRAALLAMSLDMGYDTTYWRIDIASWKWMRSDWLRGRSIYPKPAHAYDFDGKEEKEAIKMVIAKRREERNHGRQKEVGRPKSTSAIAGPAQPKGNLSFDTTSN